ncbi:uncharacterized protein LOC136025174 [Artemia franciscana]|uniref:WAP domain-containing protein n=1 Tax=Artemia franciscana TaxID=6661 RepID=A0AA88IHT5_ARTSF|nr:hypothetical protein QYM36_007841 [Artemia franciscana]
MRYSEVISIKVVFLVGINWCQELIVDDKSILGDEIQNKGDNNQGINTNVPTIDGDCPHFEIGVEKNNSKFCEQKPCRFQADCTGNLSCCYNGCIFTCLEPTPRIAVDWISEDETIWGDVTLRELEVDYWDNEHELRSGPDNQIQLEGGCLLTSEQYLAMEQFKQKNTVVDCFCDESAVKCKIRETSEDI